MSSSAPISPDDLQEYDPAAFFESVRVYRDQVVQNLAHGVQATMNIDQQDDVRCIATLVYEKDGHEGKFFTRFLMSKNEDSGTETCTMMSKTDDMSWSPFQTAVQEEG